MKRAGSMSDPLWFKDAIIYELHVKAFADGNNDGIGDFAGLLQKLDYLQDLGVTCLWLLPFFPSPQRDDGYDISDYLSVHPSYGTIEDFQAFLSAAHDRDMQVLIELVINHTSDQHPWFQAARLAPPGSPERDFYVWSDTDQLYQDARIIFTDTEKSNWTWDPVAQAYFWHRFFSHQPDLNFDNPAVIDEVLKVMRFWFDMGIDAVRLDAIPYLVERDGTNCENLPETHIAIKQIRAEIDRHYSGRMILAEANQWPSDVRPYFGDGDECHMAFHFPLMPRIYMALRQEDHLPITDIMAQTPDIPETCQWGLFLRNHDELTLEMVTSDERDYMYLAYSADPRMRINLGIRRRLAPLVDNNRRRIELLNSILFSFPGTPIIYYGDEIGMGDNIYLGDRNGVRTPMQWNGDRNAGFSRAVPAKLYSPVIMDPVWGYEALNVEAQQADQSSLLNWMRNMIALRKLFRVFGRGKLDFLPTTNRKVLAYLRQSEDERILCIANLSRFAQPVDLDLSSLEGVVPVEMLGYVEFPAITKQPYRFTLAPYGFLWLELHGTPTVAMDKAVSQLEDSELVVTAGWDSLLEGAGRKRLESTVFKEYLPKARWFGGKSRHIQTTRILDWAAIQGTKSALVLIEVGYEEGKPDTYFVPLAMGFGKMGDQVCERTPNAIFASVKGNDGNGYLYDAVFDDDTCNAILSLIDGGLEVLTRRGMIRGAPSSAFADVRGPAGTPLPPRRGSAEQSNTNVIFGDRLIMKLFRKQEAGPNPDGEIGRYLTEKANFDRIPPFAGAIEYVLEGQQTSTLGMMQGLVPNEGDGWKWTTEELGRYYEDCAPVPFPANAPSDDRDLVSLSDLPASSFARDHVGIYLDSAERLGRRTAEMHLALAQPTDDPAFAPEQITVTELGTVFSGLHRHATQVFDALTNNLPRLTEDAVEMAGLVLSRRRQILDSFRQTALEEMVSLRSRIHGDYHLGQVLRVRGDFVLLDFEGEPARSLEERRAKYSPLKDVAGMLRSFSYGAYATLMNYSTRRPEDLTRLTPWAHLWERSSAAEFLHAYRETAKNAAFLPASTTGFRRLLEAYLMDKALYELLYELNNRPTWARIPLQGILSLSL